MSNALMLFNGLSFPRSVLDRGIAWAIQSKGSLTALFLLSKQDFTGEDQHEGISQVPLDNSDTDIIESYKNLLKDAAVKAHTDLQTVVLNEPSDEDIKHYLTAGETIFIQQDDLDYLPAENSLRQLLKESPVKVELVR
jgi:hypothetical protein